MLENRDFPVISLFWPVISAEFPAIPLILFQICIFLAPIYRDLQGRLTSSWERTMLGTISLIIILTLPMQATAADKHALSDTTTVAQKAEPQELPLPPTRTGKERLGRKWSDEQRVDNCNVPFELRGPKPRPNDCASSMTAHSKD